MLDLMPDMWTLLPVENPSTLAWMKVFLITFCAASLMSLVCHLVCFSFFAHNLTVFLLFYVTVFMHTLYRVSGWGSAVGGLSFWWRPSKREPAPFSQRVGGSNMLHGLGSTGTFVLWKMEKLELFLSNHTIRILDRYLVFFENINLKCSC